MLICQARDRSKQRPSFGEILEDLVEARDMLGCSFREVSDSYKRILRNWKSTSWWPTISANFGCSWHKDVLGKILV